MALREQYRALLDRIQEQGVTYRNVPRHCPLCGAQPSDLHDHLVAAHNWARHGTWTA